MNDRIVVDDQKIKSLLMEFKNEVDKLKILFDEIEESNKIAKQIWEGIASDYVLGQFESFKNLFNEIKEKNNNYITFINTMVNKYVNETSNEISAVEDNIDAFSLRDSKI